MKRWQQDFVDGLRAGKGAAECARLYAGLPLAKVYDAREDDPEFAAAWDSVSEGEDIGEGIASTRILSPQALEAILWAQVTDDAAAAYFGMPAEEMPSARPRCSFSGPVNQPESRRT